MWPDPSEALVSIAPKGKTKAQWLAIIHNLQKNPNIMKGSFEYLGHVKSRIEKLGVMSKRQAVGVARIRKALFDPGEKRQEGYL